MEQHGPKTENVAPLVAALSGELLGGGIFGLGRRSETDQFDQGAVVWEPQNTLSTLENVSLMTQGVYGSLKSFCDQVLGEISSAAAKACSRPFALSPFARCCLA